MEKQQELDYDLVIVGGIIVGADSRLCLTRIWFKNTGSRE